jgi:hypothetical protein
MTIRFSRHAIRRMKLYRIPISVVTEILEQLLLEDGRHEIIRPIEGFPFPIKIVVAVEKTVQHIVTAYPLKKGGKT